jgi:hypothetical protein
VKWKVVHLPAEDGFAEAWSVERGSDRYQAYTSESAYWLANALKFHIPENNRLEAELADRSPIRVQLNSDGTWHPLPFRSRCSLQPKRKVRNKPKKKEGDSKGEGKSAGQRS